MDRCEQHKFSEQLVPMYKADQLGIDGVYLREAVTQEKCEVCGYVKSLAIPNLQGLIAAVAVSRVLIPYKLHGKEIRFLREALEETAKELALTVEVLPTQISRWENEAEPIGPRSEKLLRLYVVEKLAKQTIIKASLDAIFRMRIQVWRPVESELRMVFFLDKSRARASTKRQPKSRWMTQAEAA